jgi:hypothetical protein
VRNIYFLFDFIMDGLFRGVLVLSKIVPAVTEVCLRHLTHLNLFFGRLYGTLSLKQFGQIKPLGQRSFLNNLGMIVHRESSS